MDKFKQKGMTLIEICISLFILAILLLGMEATQIYTLQLTKNNYFFSVASNQIHQMTERLKLCGDTDCSHHIALWNAQNKNILPRGRGTVYGQYPHFVIDIFWGSINDKACLKNKTGNGGCLRFFMH